MYKYIVRYFFIVGETLCYAKSKKDYESNKGHKELVNFNDVVALHVSETKLEIVDEGGNHIVLKEKRDEISKYPF